MSLQSTWISLGTGNVIGVTGFLAGMGWTIVGTQSEESRSLTIGRTLPLITHPISTLLDAVIYGGFISLGAVVVSNLMPKEVAPIVSLSLALSVGYYTLKSFRCN
jgi:hypothetical protein